ncbi:MAG: DGQHR domain-containing protein [Bacilli bacterium]|nr:DGQHR domain-containing protein [Bacilli bacterium]
MKIEVIRITQQGNVFYVGKMKAANLVKIATTKIRRPKTHDQYKTFLQEIDEIVNKEIAQGDVWYLREFERDANIQRKESKKRLIEIGKDIEKINNIFPNAIICNISPLDECNGDEIVKISENGTVLEFDENKVEFSIIDGQHRLGGFNYTSDVQKYLNDYDLVVSIMIGLKPAQQAELFATINGKQKPVNKSILYDLSAMSKDEYTEQVLAHLITTWLNMHEQSPLYRKIKMLGSGEGTISQAAMIDAIQPLFSDRNYRSSFDAPVLRELYLKHDIKGIVQIIYDYLSIFITYFGCKEFDHPIYMKSTGIGGLLKAFPTLYSEFYDKTKTRTENISILKSKMYTVLEHFVPTSNKYPGGGASVQKRFAEDLIALLCSNSNVV